MKQVTTKRGSTLTIVIVVAILILIFIGIFLLVNKKAENNISNILIVEKYNEIQLGESKQDLQTRLGQESLASNQMYVWTIDVDSDISIHFNSNGGVFSKQILRYDRKAFRNKKVNLSQAQTLIQNVQTHNTVMYHELVDAFGTDGIETYFTQAGTKHFDWIDKNGKKVTATIEPNGQVSYLKEYEAK